MYTSVVIRTIFFVGKPGSGKETQARLLAEKTGYSLLSTGEKFRELRQRYDDLGTLIRKEYEAGHYLPDWFADYLFEEAVLNLSSESGIIFEGSGRTVEQVELIDTVLSWLGRKYVFINLDISGDEAVRRMLSRARSDSDTEEKIRIRIEQYELHAAPTLTLLKEKGVLVNIPGERMIEEIHKDICATLGI